MKRKTFRFTCLSNICTMFLIPKPRIYWSWALLVSSNILLWILNTIFDIWGVVFWADTIGEMTSSVAYYLEGVGTHLMTTRNKDNHHGHVTFATTQSMDTSRHPDRTLIRIRTANSLNATVLTNLFWRTLNIAGYVWR